MAILVHKHDWSATNFGYACRLCDAKVTDADVLANPAVPGLDPATHVGKKKGF